MRVDLQSWRQERKPERITEAGARTLDTSIARHNQNIRAFVQVSLQDTTRVENLKLTQGYVIPGFHEAPKVSSVGSTGSWVKHKVWKC